MGDRADWNYVNLNSKASFVADKWYSYQLLFKFKLAFESQVKCDWGSHGISNNEKQVDFSFFSFFSRNFFFSLYFRTFLESFR